MRSSVTTVHTTACPSDHRWQLPPEDRLGTGPQPVVEGLVDGTVEGLVVDVDVADGEPASRPVTHASPKLRAQARRGPASASRWTTSQPPRQASRACTVPITPPPTITTRSALFRGRS